MNIERLKAEAERLRNWDSAEYGMDFSMIDFVIKSPIPNSCGTACCIAGDIYVQHRVPSKLKGMEILAFWENDNVDPKYFARDFLGLTHDQADWLFYGDFVDDARFSDITPQQAAEALELLLEAGDDWVDEMSIDEETTEEIV